ncbi:MAG: DUF4845 domain-containing protein [Pseudazoarcus pumilus]|nr:DUF4845 domain-containing protein [Pseudazoarcus pumilus]
MSMNRPASRRAQAGVSLISTLIIGCLLAFVLFIGFRCIPVFNEYFALQRVVRVVAAEATAGATPSDVRRSFERFAYTDDIVSVRGSDLRITRTGGVAVVETAYERKVPIAGNVSLLFEFYVSSSR